MRLRTLKDIRLRNGRLVRKGRVIELDYVLAQFYLEMKAVEPAELEAMRENPEPPTGEPLSASPVGQALPQTIASESATGGKKRGRPKKRSS